MFQRGLHRCLMADIFPLTDGTGTADILQHKAGRADEQVQVIDTQLRQITECILSAGVYNLFHQQGFSHSDPIVLCQLLQSIIGLHRLAEH